jgi:hypothetical protein
LNGGKQKFVFWAFTREGVAQRRKSSKMPTWQHFLRVFVPKFLFSTKSLGKMRMETQTMVEKKNYGAKGFSSWLKI